MLGRKGVNDPCGFPTSPHSEFGVVRMQGPNHAQVIHAARHVGETKRTDFRPAAPVRGAKSHCGRLANILKSPFRPWNSSTEIVRPGHQSKQPRLWIPGIHMGDPPLM